MKGSSFQLALVIGVLASGQWAGSQDQGTDQDPARGTDKGQGPAGFEERLRAWSRAVDEEERERLARDLECEPGLEAAGLRARFAAACRSAGWRGHVLWLRIAALRDLVSEADLVAGLEHRVAPVRAMAARAVLADRRRLQATQDAGERPVAAAVRRALEVALINSLDSDRDNARDNADRSVREAALVALHACGALDAATLQRVALAAPDDEVPLRIACADPLTFAPFLDGFLGAGVGAGVGLVRCLEGLRGAMIAPSTRAVVTALAKDPLQDAEARLAACLLLESSSWPADFDALLRGGLVRSSENAERLLVILPPRFAANLARQIFEADDENLVLRGLSALERVDDAVLADFLTKVERLIPAARDRVARILLERLPKQTLQRSKFILESSVDVDFQEAWVEAVGERLARFREGRKVLLNLLRPAEAEERPRLADLAFKSCVAAQYYVPELAAHAGEDAQRLAVLSRLGTLVPSEFWIATLDSAATVDVQLRAVAALGMYAQTEAIAATLRGLATGPWRQCRVAALQAYLAVPEPHDLEGFLASVLRVADLGLDTALIEVLETSQRDFVRPALAYLASTRIADLLLEARALHGDDEAARALFEAFESLPMSRLRRLRDSIARALGPDDLDRIFQALDPGRRSASSWVLSEVFEWLALRPDAFPGEGPNSLDARLRAFAAREEDDELATAAHVLLVRRGQLDVLSETLDRWMREAAEEDEGRLLELLSVLPTDVGPRGVELAFDILAAPARDVAALLDFERKTPIAAGRTEAAYQGLQQTIQWLARLEASVVERGFTRFLADPKRRERWARVPIEGKLRMLQVVARSPGALVVLRPLLASTADETMPGTLLSALTGLFSSRLLYELGDLNGARRAFDAARVDLEVHGLRDRHFEVVVRDVLPTSSGEPRAALRAFGHALRAQTSSDAAEAASLREAVRLALRDDPGFAARILQQ